MDILGLFSITSKCVIKKHDDQMVEFSTNY